jgi:platelet-activating factor acetylhydrolase IB subunit alpha
MADPGVGASASVGDDVDGGSPSKSSSSSSSSSAVPILEKKWTAVPRLQRRVLELERQVATNARMHAHRGDVGDCDDDDVAGGRGSAGGVVGVRERRLLPKSPATHTLSSHSSAVTCVALHPVYTVAASGSEDGTVKLWDHESGEYLRTLRGHTNGITSLDFSPRGTYLVSSSTDLSIKIWDVKEYKCVRTLRGHDHTISAVRFVPPNFGAPYLLGGNTAGRGGAEAGGGGDGGGGGGGGIDPSSCGSKFLVSASRDRTVKFWDIETGFCDHTLSDHGDWVRCIAVRPASGSPRSSSSSTPSSSEGGGREDQGTGMGVGTSSPALVATSGNDRTIYVYNANDKREKVCELRGHDHVVESLSFLCSSTLPRASTTNMTSASQLQPSSWDYLASGSRDRTVRLWSVADGSCLMTFKSHENWVRCVLVHPSGNHVLSCGDDRTIRVYDIKSNRCLRTIADAHPHFVTSMAVHHALPIMVSGGVDHTVKCWQLV